MKFHSETSCVGITFWEFRIEMGDSTFVFGSIAGI